MNSYLALTISILRVLIKKSKEINLYKRKVLYDFDHNID
jgi:hypothetical protein